VVTCRCLPMKGKITYVLWTIPIFAVVFVSLNHNEKEPVVETVFSDELQEDLAKVAELPIDFDTTIAFFSALAEEKGAIYAFNVLINAEIPKSIDTHLLGHEVGAILYDQHGLAGMGYCTHDLRNACSHMIVIGAFLDYGVDVFDKLNEVCHEAPGGPGAYSLCFHGLGHGTLAYAGYDIPKAVEFCSLVNNESPIPEEEMQCIGGVIMEMYQGAHDPDAWSEKVDEFVDLNNPLSICKADYMPNLGKSVCYSYITPFLFDAAKLVTETQEDQFKKSFTYCDEIDSTGQRRSCYGGIGKEFVTFAFKGDTRAEKRATDKEITNLLSMCALAHKKEAYEACVLEALDTLYWGGENDPYSSVKLCNLIPEDGLQNDCFDHLFDLTQFYRANMDTKQLICELTTIEYREFCTKSIGLSI